MTFPMMANKGGVLLWSAAFVYGRPLLTPPTSPAMLWASSTATRSKSCTTKSPNVSA